MITQTRPKLQSTGARYHANRKKKLYESGSEPTLTKLGARRVDTVKTKGGLRKVKLFSSDIANVLDTKSMKYEKIKIKTVSGNPANRHFIRRNIMTKGAIIETEKGKARITSRPGQDGTINAVLIQ
jgi:small subunit ribosomal protein S8e